MRYTLRGLAGEPQTAYLPDTTLNRIINTAHRAIGLLLWDETAIESDTIACTAGKHTYQISPSSDSLVAMRGNVSAVRRRTEENQGGGDIGLVQVSPDKIGKLGEGVIPNSFAVRGDELVLATTPLGGDTLFVDFVPVASTLDADADTLSIGAEDQPAMLYMALAMIYGRDHQVQLAQMYWQMSQAMIAAKRPREPQRIQP